MPWKGESIQLCTDCIPLLPEEKLSHEIILRVIALNSVGREYDNLLDECNQLLDGNFSIRWAREDSRLPDFSNTSSHRDICLRSDYARRQALVELDVLVAQSMGITIHDFLDAVHLLFPLVLQADASTFYDGNGRIAFSSATFHGGKGMSRKKNHINEFGFDDIFGSAQGEFTYSHENQVASNDVAISTIAYKAPFDQCDRLEDYRIAWEFFEKEGAST